MNIFVTSPDPAACARVLADRHVVKMCLETGQILWSALDLLGRAAEPVYRPTHRGHPCVRWAAADPDHFVWLEAHGRALAAEYARRFGREHKSLAAIEAAAKRADWPHRTAQPTWWAVCVDADLKASGEPFEAYRRQLRRKYLAWGPAARWTSPSVRPEWATEAADRES